MLKKTRYILTGANGHLGNTILKKLNKKFVEVYGLVLPGTKTYEKAHYIEGDVRDKESLRPLFEGATGDIYVIHTASIISIQNKVTPTLYDVNVNGTKNLLDLAKEYKVKRFLYVSSVHALPELNKNDVITECNTFSEDDVIGAYAKTKAIATQLVLDYKDDLDVVVVHPSGIIGPDDNSGNHLVQMITDYLSGNLPACVEGGYDFVDVRDVANGTIQALEKGKSGECYILSNKHYDIKQVLNMVRSEAKCKKLVVLPIWVAKMFAPLIELIAKHKNKKPLYTKYSLYTLTANDNFSNQKAKKELGYKTRDLRETIKDTVRWYNSTLVTK